MKFGPRKLAALGALIGLAIVSVTAGYWLGTPGLLGVLIFVVLIAFLGLAWLVIQAERRTQAALARLSNRIEKVRGPIDLEKLASLLEERDARAGLDGEQVDRILTSIHLRLTRTETLNEAAIRELVDRLDAIDRNPEG